jgi:hypothetical protein
VDLPVRARAMTSVFETFAKDRIIVLPEDAPSAAHCIVAILDQDLETLRREAATTIPTRLIADSRQAEYSHVSPSVFAFDRFELCGSGLTSRGGS